MPNNKSEPSPARTSDWWYDPYLSHTCLVARTFTSTNQKNTDIKRAKTELKLNVRVINVTSLTSACERTKAAAAVCCWPPTPVLWSGWRPSDNLASWQTASDRETACRITIFQAGRLHLSTKNITGELLLYFSHAGVAWNSSFCRFCVVLAAVRSVSWLTCVDFAFCGQDSLTCYFRTENKILCVYLGLFLAIMVVVVSSPAVISLKSTCCGFN